MQVGQAFSLPGPYFSSLLAPAVALRRRYFTRYLRMVLRSLLDDASIWPCGATGRLDALFCGAIHF